MSAPLFIRHHTLARPLQAVFTHVRPDPTVLPLSSQKLEYIVLRECAKRNNNGATICRLCPVLDDGKPDFSKAVAGVAFCAPGDNFSRRLGRRHAFLAAMDNLGAAQFGAEYYHSSRHPREHASFVLASRSFRKAIGNAFNAWEAENRRGK